MVASVGSALKLAINITISYLDNNRSRFLPISFKCTDIKNFFGLHEQQITLFSEIVVNISFEGKSSRIY